MADRKATTGFSDAEVSVTKGFGDEGLDTTEYGVSMPYNITPEDGQFTIGPELTSTHYTSDNDAFNAQETDVGLLIKASILDLTPKTSVNVYGGGGVAFSDDFASSAHGDAETTASYFKGGVGVEHEFGTNNMFSSAEITAGVKTVNAALDGSGMDADDTTTGTVGVVLNF